MNEDQPIGGKGECCPPLPIGRKDRKEGQMIDKEFAERAFGHGSQRPQIEKKTDREEYKNKVGHIGFVERAQQQCPGDNQEELAEIIPQRVTLFELGEGVIASPFGAALQYRSIRSCAFVLNCRLADCGRAGLIKLGKDHTACRTAQTAILGMAAFWTTFGISNGNSRPADDTNRCRRAGALPHRVRFGNPFFLAENSGIVQSIEHALSGGGIQIALDDTVAAGEELLYLLLVPAGQT